MVPQGLYVGEAGFSQDTINVIIRTVTDDNDDDPSDYSSSDAAGANPRPSWGEPIPGAGGDSGVSERGGRPAGERGAPGAPPRGHRPEEFLCSRGRSEG